MHLCKDCGINNIPKGQLYCSECRKPPWRNTGRNLQLPCYNCGYKKNVDDNGLCEECYVKIHRPRYETVCGKCEKSYQPDFKLQWLCNNCRPSCTGCRNKFDPTSRTDTLCFRCYSKKHTKAACGSCGTVAELNSYALCEDCNNRTYIDKYCEVCSTHRGIKRKRICVPCSSVTNDCPRCGKQKDAKEYVCNRCKIIQEKEYN